MSSPWKNPEKISQLKESLRFDNSASVPEKEENKPIPINSTIFYPSPSNVRNNSEYRKWCIKYSEELNHLYNIFLNGLKKTAFNTKDLKNKFSLDEFKYFLYQKTSTYNRKCHNQRRSVLLI